MIVLFLISLHKSKSLQMQLESDMIIKYIKDNILPILFVIGGIIDQSTDLLAQLLTDLNAPSWCPIILRVVIISFGAFKLYYTTPKKIKS